MAPELCSKTCVYDLPPDEDFILDRLPTSPLITVGTGASHAAMFASPVGRILAYLAPRE
jgi:sarcosine oxidase